MWLYHFKKKISWDLLLSDFDFFFFWSITLDCMWTCILSSSSLSKGTLKLNASLLTHLDSRSPLWGFLYNIRPILVYWGKQKPNQQRGYREGSHPPPKGERGGKMAALASSLIRQKRAVKDDQANRPVASKRKPCPKSNKSLCQKQILVLISKVRLCGGRKGRNDKRPGESLISFPSCFSVHPYFGILYQRWELHLLS